MRYIGSKERLLDFINDFVDKKIDISTETPQNLSFADLFCGTATVSNFFKNKGYKIVANDIMTFSVMWAKATLAPTSQTSFNKLIESGEVQIYPSNNLFGNNNFENTLEYLNNLNRVEGFIYNEYSPEGNANRLYFTGSNAAKIDSIRYKIKTWKESNLINEYEEAILISCLLIAANRVANIAGTYGAFLKDWDKRAFKPLTLEAIELNNSDTPRHIVLQDDVLRIADQIETDIAYLDPPYNFRQYGAYYHVLETIAIGDTPVVTGKTGLRPWQDKKSDFCYNDKAANALTQLITKLNSQHIFLSYNADGILEHDTILEILKTKGTVDFKDISFQRYKSNNGGNGNLKVKERLYYVRKQRAN
jgi:adenine-specific DNA-methyltransferase